jgi:hypothetical protein
VCPPRDRTARGDARPDGGRRAGLFDASPDPTVAYRIDDASPVVVAANAAYEDRFGSVTAGDPLAETLPAVASGVPDGADLAAGVAAGDTVDVTVQVASSDDLGHGRGHDDHDDRPGDGRRSAPGGADGAASDGGRTYRVRSCPVEDGPDGPERSAGGVDGYLLFTPWPDRPAGRTDREGRLDLFASVVSHDLRNPLDVARIRLDAAEETGDSVHFEKVRAAHDRIQRLSRDVLFLADVDRSIDPTSVDPAAVAGAAWEAVGAETATLDVAPVPTVRADRGLVRRLFENLFENAVEHAGDAVTVRVEPVSTAEGAAGVAVVDDGPGIPPGARDRVFEPRETLDGGTGLGLAVVARVAEVHGWQVRVTDAADGGGARFEVTGLDPVEDSRRHGEG